MILARWPTRVQVLMGLMSGSGVQQAFPRWVPHPIWGIISSGVPDAKSLLSISTTFWHRQASSRW